MAKARVKLPFAPHEHVIDEAEIPGLRAQGVTVEVLGPAADGEAPDASGSGGATGQDAEPGSTPASGKRRGITPNPASETE